MIIKFINEDGKIQTKFLNEELKLVDFDYVTFINKFYDGDDIELQFNGVEDEDRKKLESFVDEIRETKNTQDKKYNNLI